MRKVIIGSVAMKHWFSDFDREIKDIDYATDYNQNLYCSKTKTEYLYNPVLMDYIDDVEVLSPELLLTLKMSHISWNVNFKKHMFDIQFLLKKEIKYDKKLYSLLYEYWKNVKKTRRSNLSLNSDEFFTNALNEFDHDYLHTLIKDVPTYTKVLKDGCEVEPCIDKFNLLSFEDKLSLIKEEVMVMSYERFRNYQYRVGYNKMLEKYVTSHAPEWQLMFIIENYIELTNPRKNYIKIIEEKL